MATKEQVITFQKVISNASEKTGSTTKDIYRGNCIESRKHCVFRLKKEHGFSFNLIAELFNTTYNTVYANYISYDKYLGNLPKSKSTFHQSKTPKKEVCKNQCLCRNKPKENVSLISKLEKRKLEIQNILSKTGELKGELEAINNLIKYTENK